MNSPLCDWTRVLRWFRLHAVWFDGGEIIFGDGQSGSREFDPWEEGGIVYIGADVLTVVHKDRQYWIPFNALKEIRGTCQPWPNQRAAMTMRSAVSGWVDDEPPLPESDEVDTIVWHSFILRSGRQIAGVVVHVSDTGVQVRTAQREMVSIPWTTLGAAVELLE